MVLDSTAVAPPSLPQRAANPATVLLAPLLTALLFYLCFFPVAIGWLGWLAFLPFLCLVRLPGRPRFLYWATYAGGLAFALPVLQWMRVADPRMYITWVALSLYLAAFWPLTLALLRFIDRRKQLPLVVSFPFVVVALEFIRWGLVGSFYSLLTASHEHDIPGGFGWYCLGHTQHDFLEIIQIADTFGVYGVSFVLASATALLFEILYAREWFRVALIGHPTAPGCSRTHILRSAVVVGGLILGCLSYGVWRLGQETSTAGPSVAYLQGFIDQKTRNSKNAEARQSFADHYTTLAELAGKQRPDLIVWPETSYPGGWAELSNGKPGIDARQLADDMTKSLRTHVLLGMTAVVGQPQGRPAIYNSAILIGPDPINGHWLGRYDKIHRVPFGEYTPLGETLPWLHRLVPYDEDPFSVKPGTQFTRFELPCKEKTYSFGVVICYEDTDPAMARPYVAGEQPVDFLLNISNDGWFDGTAEHDQHLAICRFRAVECRRAVGRAVNMGISAVIDSNGRVLEPEISSVINGGIWKVNPKSAKLPIRRWGEFKKVSGILLAQMPIDTRRSLYSQIGDLFAICCLGFTLVSIFANWFTRQRPTPDSVGNP